MAAAQGWRVAQQRAQQGISAMSIVQRIRTLSFTALVAALVVAPGCDDGSSYEALGVSAEELEAMSPEELAALELDLADREEDLPCDTHGAFQGEFAVADVDAEGEQPGRPGVENAPDDAVQPFHPTHAGEGFLPNTAEFGAALGEDEPCDFPRDMKLTAR